MKNLNSLLIEKIKLGLLECEQKEELVVTSTVPDKAAKVIADRVKEAYVDPLFSPDELVILRLLASEAVRNEKLFYGELESITGYSKKQMNDFSNKLRELVSRY